MIQQNRWANPRKKVFRTWLRQQTPLNWAVRYGLAVAVVAVAFEMRLTLTAWFGGELPAYITFYPAVMAVALLGGFGPGVVATVVSGIVAGYYILPPVREFAIASPADRLGLAIFIGMGLFMSAVAELYRRGRAKAAAYDRELALRESRQALHESEDRYRNLFNTMDEGFCIIEMIFDAQDKPVDYRFLKVNAAFERQTGLHEAEGRRMRELAPAHEAHWFEIYGKVALTGDPIRFVNEARALDRWFDVHAYRVGDPRLRQVAIVFNDFTEQKRAEQALRQKEAELTDAQRIAHVGNWHWDRTTDVTTGSDEMLRIFGFDPAMERMPDFGEQRGRCYPVDDWERVNAAVQWAVQTGHGYELDVRAIRAGAPIWLTTRGEAVRDAAGQIVGLRGTVQDITERKQADEAVQRSQALLHAVTDNSPDPIYLKDRECRLLFANPATLHAIGKPAAEVIGKTDEEFYDDPAIGRAIMANDRRIMESGRNEAVEEAVPSPDGSMRTFLSTKSLFRDAEGQVIGIVGVARDITERKQAEEALQEREERLRLHVQNTPLAVIEWGPDFRLSRWSAEAEHIFGWRAEEVLGKRLDEFRWVYDEDVAHVAQVAAGLIDGTRPRSVSHNRNYRKDGTLVHCEWYNSSLVDESGRMRSILSLVLDVTDRKRAEDALRQSESSLRRFYDSGLVGVMYWNMDGRITDANDKFLEMIGYQREDLAAGRIDWLNMTPRQYRGLDERSIAELKATGVNKAPFEKEFIRKDGTRVPVIIAGTMLDEARFNGVAFVLDITDRKSREQRIAKLTRLYAVLSEVNEAIVRGHDSQSLYSEVCRIVAEEGAFRLAWIGEVREQQVVPLASWGPGADYLNEITVAVHGALGDGPTGTCVRENRAVVNGDFATNPAAAPWRDAALRYGIRASAAFPLCRQGKAVGALTLYAADPNAFDAEQVGLLEALTADLSYALDAIDHEQVRLRAEQAMRESELRFRTMSDAIPQLAWIAKADGYIYWYNRRWYDYTGTTPEQMEGWGWQSVHDPEMLPDVLQRWKASIASGEPFDLTFPLRGADGVFRPFLTRGMPLKDEQGHVQQWFGTNTDISEQKQAEIALQTTLQRFYVVLSNMYAAVLLVTDERRVEFANQAFCDRYGLADAPTDLVGLGAHDMLAKIKTAYLHPDEALARIREILDQGEPVRGEEVAMRGGKACLRDFIPLNVDGKSYGRLWIHVDISERKKVEEEMREAKEAAEAASVAKSQFLANMSHELRTPMNAILGMIDVALPKTIDPTVQDCLRTAKGSADLLLTLLNDLLDSARIESGKLELEAAPFSLRRMLEQMTRVLAGQVSDNGLAFRCHVSDDAPDAVLGDRVRLQQILLNLVGNAIKFTQRGEVAVDLRVVEEPVEGLGIRDWGLEQGKELAGSVLIPQPSSLIPSITLEFAVRDTGIGIAPAAQERLFQPFAQADASMTRRFGGTGLGLSICKNLVEMMGGRIWVQSELGQGSTFHFTVRLPLAKELPADFETLSVVSAAAVRKLRILLVEDNPANQKLATYILEDRGHAVDTAEDGQEAILLTGKNRYDVVLMDVQMPGMDGLEATAAIRKREGEGSRLPIVAMTAHARDDDRQRCLQAGMDDYLSKPIDADEMIAVVESVAARAAAISAATAAPPAAMVFDLASALSQCLNNRDLLRQVIGIFFKDADSLLPQMRAALQNGDLPEVGRLGHRLKGTLIHLDASAAKAAAKRVERFLLHAGEQADAEAALAALEHQCAVLKAALAAVELPRDAT